MELQPNLPEAPFGLGLALGEQGRMSEAVTYFRKAIKLKPDYLEARGNLGFALKAEGEFREALAELKQGYELTPPKDPARPAIQNLIQACQRQIALEERLPAILTGEAEPASSAERIEFAKVCALKKLFVSAAELYQDAFRSEPELAANVMSFRRYDAAAAAIRASHSPEQEHAALSQADRARWRKQALDWLRADLSLLQKKQTTPQGRVEARKWLLLLKRSPAFAPARDTSALEQLPEAEREEFRKLWADVESLLARITGPRK
jgi:tetratricopeptide (TPR) repeat protein